MIDGLDLFSGIGGLTLALEPWVRPLAYCEKDKYCQSVLLSRQTSNQLPNAPIWDDILTLSGSQFEGSGIVDIIYGGFPCQDISIAGNGEGLEGERSGLFFELYRLVKEISPSFVFLENVPAIRTRGMEVVIKKLTDIGYDCRWTCVSAAEVGAKHIRKRWFLLAHSRRQGLERLECNQKTWTSQPMSSDKDAYSNWEEAFYKFPRMDNELPRPMDRVKALGNAVVPAQAREAFKRLMNLH